MIKLDKERIYLHCPAPVIICAADVSPAPSADALESAIRRAAARHGSLCSRVERSPQACFEPCEPCVRIARAKMESEYDWLGVAERERERPFDIAAGEFIRFTLLEAAARTQVVAAMHHLAGDGRSLFILFEDIAEALENPDKTFEPLPMEYIDQAALAGGKLSGMPAMMVKMCNRRWKQQGRAFGEEEYAKLFAAAAAAQPAPVVCCHEFSQELTAALIRACHARETTVTAAICAAMSEAWREPGDIGVTVSIREKECRTMGNYATGVTVQADPRGAAFWPLAQTVGRSLRAALGDPSKKYFLMRFMSAVEPTLIDAVWYQTYGAIRHPMVAQMADLFGFGSRAKGTSISNVGIADIGPGGEHKWSGLWILPPHMPNALRTVSAATCAGSLGVTAQFADDADADRNSERFEDAMMLLEEATVS